jgi:hypothetical protein
MSKFYLHKVKKRFSIEKGANGIKQGKDGVFVSINPQFSGKVNINDKQVKVKLYPAFKPGGPKGAITKNPNKYVIEIEGEKRKQWDI